MKHIICLSFKKELLEGLHKISDNYKLALFNEKHIGNQYTQSYYDYTNEIEGYGYTLGGIDLQPFVVLNKNVAILSFKNVIINNCTLNARWALIYNNTLTNKNAISIIDFEKIVSTENGDLIIIFPEANSKEGFIRIV